MASLGQASNLTACVCIYIYIDILACRRDKSEYEYQHIYIYIHGWICCGDNGWAGFLGFCGPAIGWPVRRLLAGQWARCRDSGFNLHFLVSPGVNFVYEYSKRDFRNSVVFAAEVHNYEPSGPRSERFVGDSCQVSCLLFLFVTNALWKNREKRVS